MNTYVYEYKNALYFNLTNKCSNSCNFCVRNHSTDLVDKKLWITKEPTFEDIKNQMPKDITKYEEFVFCGYGEPTYRVDLIKQLAKYLKQYNKTIRINTNGQGNLINNRSIVKDLVDLDVISISLNAPNSKIYQEVCHSIFGENGFDALLLFAKEVQNNNQNVVLTIVDSISQDQIEDCKKLCKNLNLPLRIRTYY